VFAASGLLGTHAESGVYRSNDFGHSWRPINRGLAVPGGVDLEITPDGLTLYLAATEGGVAALHMDPVRTPGGRVP
jgi:hypothetical protein